MMFGVNYLARFHVQCVYIVVKKGVIKEKITAEMIMDLYEKAKKIKEPKNKSKAYKNIKLLTCHVGEYLIKPLD